MDDNRKEDLNEIRKIEDKYGLVLFRTGLTHLVDVGIRHLDSASLEECFKQISEQEKMDKVAGKISIMTPDFQREIVRCAAELAQFSIWTLFAYIKEYVEVSL